MGIKCNQAYLLDFWEIAVFCVEEVTVKLTALNRIPPDWLSLSRFLKVMRDIVLSASILSSATSYRVTSLKPTTDPAFFMSLFNLFASFALLPAPQGNHIKEDGARNNRLIKHLEHPVADIIFYLLFGSPLALAKPLLFFLESIPNTIIFSLQYTLKDLSLLRK